MTKLDAIAKRPATYDDVLAAPPHMVAELVEGALVLQPRPASRHALAVSALTAKVGGPNHHDEGGPGGWWILGEPELHLGRDVLVPDLAGWRRERMPEFPDAAFFEMPPDWVCEVLSPSTRRHDLTGKRNIYRTHGVGHLWFVDPDARLLEAFRAGPDGWTLLGAVADDEAVTFEPFTATPFGLATLWPPRPPPAVDP